MVWLQCRVVPWWWRFPTMLLLTRPPMWTRRPLQVAVTPPVRQIPLKAPPLKTSMLQRMLRQMLLRVLLLRCGMPMLIGRRGCRGPGRGMGGGRI